MDLSPDSIFFGLAPEPVIHTDFDSDFDFDVDTGRQEVFASFEEWGDADEPGGGSRGGTFAISESTGEREAHMDASFSKPHRVIGWAKASAQCQGMVFYSWQPVKVFAKTVCESGRARIGSMRSWHCRESALRATETIRRLISYFSLFGGCASGGGAGGVHIPNPNFSVFEARSRRGVFAPFLPAAGFLRPLTKHT